MIRSENKRLALLRQRLESLENKRVLRDPMAFVEDKRLTLDHLQKSLTYAADRRLAVPRQKLGTLAAKLDAMSPLKVLGRGFAMVTGENGQIVKSTSDVKCGETVSVALAQGSLDCRVERVNRQEGSHE